MKKIAWALTCAAAILIGTGAAQAATVITFDDLTVTGVIETDVTTQYAGVTFAGARLLNSPGQLNDFNFPPFTAPNVIANDANGILQPLSLTFDMPVTSVGAYLTTMAVPLTLSAFDGATFLGRPALPSPILPMAAPVRRTHSSRSHSLRSPALNSSTAITAVSHWTM